MLPWIRRWRDWAMHDLFSMHRIGPQPQALHYSYEKAGLTLRDQAIPWNAEVVVVEAQLRLPAAVARRKADFQLKFPGQPGRAPESLRRLDREDWYRLLFRCPPPSRTVAAELTWRHYGLCQLTLPYVGREEFLQSIRLEMPTLFVRLGDQSVACQTFVSTQCRGLMASAVVTAATSLAPVADLGLHVEFRSDRGSPVHAAPAQLTTSQLAERRALVAVVPRRVPRRMGTWLATWLLADRPLVTQRVKAISQRHFQRSLRLADTRFVVQPHKGAVALARQLPPSGEFARAGPCFFVASKEPGMAGLSSFQVHAQVPGAVEPPVLLDQEVLVTDGPSVIVPGTLDAGDLAQIIGFELRLKGEVLGVLSTSPIPAANFTAEGGFKSANDFTWTAAAEDELSERLNRLFEEKGLGK
jgi:hypothetical protein